MISIRRLAEIREELNVTHLILFSIDENGVQNVATHGKSEKQAIEAAEMGNKLKMELGWNKHLNTRPVERKCINCDYFQMKHGIGYTPCYCNFSIKSIEISEDKNACGNFLSRY